MDALRNRQMLLILDNFEQVMPAASQIAELLAAASRVEMIVTSRTVLNVRGEVEFAVPTLTLPRPLGGTNHAEQSAAVQLFELAARAVKSDFVITQENAGVVAEICARLDGLPLAIELAAARIKMLSPQAILSRLIDAGQQARLLSGGARDLPARQQTLQNTLDWSYGLLEPREQVLFARLSVFVGGWTLESSAAACGFDSDELEVMDTLSSLADKSLITRVEPHKDGERFAMLNTIREYAATKLDASGETDEARKHHAQYFVQLVQRAEPELRGARQYQWLTRLEHENDNFQAALSWLIEGGDPVTAAQLGWSLRLYWLITSRLSEGLRWMISALSRLDVSPASPPSQIEARARALAVAGLSSAWQGNGDWASFLLQEAESLCVHLTAPDIEALVHAGLAIAALYTPDPNEASIQFEKSLALFRRIGDSWGAAMVMGGIERLAISRGDYVTTQRLFEESQSLAQSLGDSISLSLATFELGRMDLRRQDTDAALKHFGDALRHASHAGYREGIARGLVGLAETVGTCKDAERAATLLGAAHAVRNTLGIPMWQVETSAHDDLVKETRAQMGEKYDQAWSRGARMTLDEAVAYALA
jgi:predicted ATPase